LLYSCLNNKGETGVCSTVLTEGLVDQLEAIFTFSAEEKENAIPHSPFLLMSVKGEVRSLHVRSNRKESFFRSTHAVDEAKSTFNAIYSELLYSCLNNDRKTRVYIRDCVHVRYSQKVWWTNNYCRSILHALWRRKGNSLLHVSQRKSG
jgi:hypothetical protein